MDYPVAPKFDVLVLLKELISMATLTYFFDVTVVEDWRESRIWLKTKRITIFLKANMLGLWGAVGDYYTWWVYNEPTNTRGELIATKQ